MTISSDSFPDYSVLLDAVETSQDFLQQQAINHKRGFMKIARNYTFRTLANEPYLRFEILKHQWLYLTRLSRLLERTAQVQTKSVNSNVPLPPKLNKKIMATAKRTALELDRTLDARRQ